MKRDMTIRQFKEALVRHGMRGCPLAGYVAMGPFGKCSQALVYPRNAGPNRRAQLAYLLEQKERLIKEYGE